MKNIHYMDSEDILFTRKKTDDSVTIEKEKAKGEVLSIHLS